MHLCTTPNCCHCINFAAPSSFWYMCFVQLRTSCYIRFCAFTVLVYAFCTAPNHILLLNLHHHSFGICVFAQFRTEHLHLRQRDLFWYMYYCVAPNRINEKTRVTYCFGICVFVQLRTIICFKFTFYHVLVYVLLCSSEPIIISSKVLVSFWYMCFCTAPNPVKLIAKWLNVFWYMRAVQL